MKIKDFIEQPKYFKEPKEDELCPLQKLIIWLKEQNTFYKLKDIHFCFRSSLGIRVTFLNRL